MSVVVAMLGHVSGSTASGVSTHVNASRHAMISFSIALLLAPALLAAHEPAAERSSASKFRVTDSFDGSNAENPQGWNLVKGPREKMYGVSQTGGDFDLGTVYEVNGGGQVKLLHAFRGGTEGEQPQGLAVDDRGDLYGVTVFGGTQDCTCGTVFKITRAGQFQVIHLFNGEDGAHPTGHLAFKDGVFYGTTETGGANGAGSLYRMTRSGDVSLIHSFAHLESSFGPVFPSMGLSFGADGLLYGTAGPSNSYPDGFVYRSTTQGEVEILHVFDGASGSQPLSVPIQATDGNLYGVTPFGGEFGSGVLYRIDESGAFSVVLSFPGGPGTAFPFGKLEQASNGHLYGVGAGGGTPGNGTLYEITKRGEVRTLYEFQAGTDGIAGVTGLTEHSPGVFFGLSPSGGRFGSGNIYRFALGK